MIFFMPRVFKLAFGIDMVLDSLRSAHLSS